MVTASSPLEWAKVRHDLAVVLDYDDLSCGLVGGDVHGNRVDVCQGFRIATIALTFWRLRSTRLAVFGKTDELVLASRSERAADSGRRARITPSDRDIARQILPERFDC